MNLDDTPDAPPKATNPLWKRIKRVLNALLVSVVVICGLIAVTLSYHPRWHTVTGIGKPGEWVGSVECPENWQLEADANSMSAMSFTSLHVRRKPLTGVWAWWNRYVLRNPVGSQPAEMTLYIMPEPRFEVVGMPPAPKMNRAERVSHAETALDSFEFGYKAASQGNPRIKFAVKRIPHPLGPALEVSQGNAQTGGEQNSGFSGFQDDTLCIAPTEAGDFTGTVMVTSYAAPEEAAALKPILERMTRGIRLVKK